MKADADGGWLLITVAGLFLLDALWSLGTGRVRQTWKRRWDLFAHTYYIERDEHPFLFWLLVSIQLAVGAAILLFGVRMLLR